MELATDRFYNKIIPLEQIFSLPLQQMTQVIPLLLCTGLESLDVSTQTPSFSLHLPLGKASYSHPTLQAHTALQD